MVSSKSDNANPNMVLAPIRVSKLGNSGKVFMPPVPLEAYSFIGQIAVLHGERCCWNNPQYLLKTKTRSSFLLAAICLLSGLALLAKLFGWWFGGRLRVSQRSFAG